MIDDANVSRYLYSEKRVIALDFSEGSKENIQISSQHTVLMWETTIRTFFVFVEVNQ